MKGEEMKFEVVFYEEGNKRPVERFLNELPVKKRAKVVGYLTVLEEKGNTVREPYSKYLRDGIYELRCDNIRLLYFFTNNRIIILTNGFIKKTNKLPAKELLTAILRRKEYLERNSNENIKRI